MGVPTKTAEQMCQYGNNWRADAEVRQGALVETRLQSRAGGNSLNKTAEQSRSTRFPLPLVYNVPPLRLV